MGTSSGAAAPRRKASPLVFLRLILAGGARGSAAGGRVLIKRSVGAVRVVVLEVLLQYCGEVARSGDQEVVEALAAQGVDPVLSDRIRSRCSSGRGDANVVAAEYGGKRRR
jgi:hypothetical protein